MANPGEPSISERLRDHAAVDEVVRSAAAEAVRAHRRAGNPVTVWRDGRVVDVSPDEVPLPGDARPTRGSDAA